MTLLLFIPMVILIAFSAFFSASEMVFSAANRMRLENAAEDGNRSAKLALKIVDKFDNTLSSVLVGNNLVNIATSAIGSIIAVELWGEEWTWAMTLLLTVAVIIFGETMPKIIAKKNANKLALILCYPIRFLTIILKPITVIVVFLVNLIMFILPKPKQVKSEEEAQEELAQIIETAEDEEVLDESQTELLQNALEFDDTMVREVMTARVDIEAIDIEDSIEDILVYLGESTSSRIPVYDDTIDNIVGILSKNRLYRALAAGEEIDIRSLIRPAVYLYKTTRLPMAISVMSEAKQRIGIVVDEYGGTMGLVTFEDIMEQLVGEIWDEKDPHEEEEVIERSYGIYELDGDMQMYDLADLLGWRETDITEFDSDTVGGLTCELYGTCYFISLLSFRYHFKSFQIISLSLHFF